MRDIVHPQLQLCEQVFAIFEEIMPNF